MTWSKLLYRRIDQDNMMTLAGNLAYVSLLSLVPLVAVIFALFAVFPIFADISVQLRQFIFTNFMPATGDVIEQIDNMQNMLLLPCHPVVKNTVEINKN